MAVFISKLSSLTIMKQEILMCFRRDKSVRKLCTNIHSDSVSIHEMQYLDFIEESKYNLLSDLPENLLCKLRTFQEEELSDQKLIDSNILTIDDINFILTIKYMPTVGEIVLINNEMGW